MPESLRSRLRRWGFNFFPAYRGTGAQLTYLAADWREIRIKLPLSWRTRNYVGTIYGGSMYGAVDPFYMVMLINLLGPDYVVWDKAAAIQFERPGRSTLYATFLVARQETDAIVAGLAGQRSLERHYQVRLVDRDGIVHATVDKTIYIRHKDARKAPS
jgi:hypothetical protein